jgi:putative transposase
MDWKPKHLTTKQLEERRLAAARLLRRRRHSQAEVGRKLGVSQASVSRWVRHRGAARRKHRLAARPRTGRPPKLDAKGWRQVCRALERGAVANGFPTERWTLERIARLIERTQGVHFNPNYLSGPLRSHGFTPQLPKTRARERDEVLIAAWLQRDWPRIKRGLQSTGGRWPS